MLRLSINYLLMLDQLVPAINQQYWLIIVTEKAKRRNSHTFKLRRCLEEVDRPRPAVFPQSMSRTVMGIWRGFLPNMNKHWLSWLSSIKTISAETELELCHMIRQANNLWRKNYSIRNFLPTFTNCLYPIWFGKSKSANKSQRGSAIGSPGCPTRRCRELCSPSKRRIRKPVAMQRRNPVIKPAMKPCVSSPGDFWIAQYSTLAKEWFSSNLLFRSAMKTTSPSHDLEPPAANINNTAVCICDCVQYMYHPLTS